MICETLDDYPAATLSWCTTITHDCNGVAMSDIYSLITKLPTTSCALDPLPTWLLMDVSDGLAPNLTQLIDFSIKLALSLVV